MLGKNIQVERLWGKYGAVSLLVCSFFPGAVDLY